MKTVVYQSFRTQGVPSWIEACLSSVRGWASLQGFDYRFYDDSFFDLVPRGLFARASRYKCVLADYARLVAAKDLLREGYDRVIWLDADALVFAPEKFAIHVESGYAFCREVWLDRIVFGKPHFRLTVNNAVSVFCRDETIIDFYLDAANEILGGSKPLDSISIGTEFLSKLQRAHPFPLLKTVGIFGPVMAPRYLQNDGRFLRPYLNYQTSPIHAANLCLSHQGVGRMPPHPGEIGLDDETLLAFVRKLQTDQGASLNAWFDGDYQPPVAEFERPLSRYVTFRHALRTIFRAAQGK